MITEKSIYTPIKVKFTDCNYEYLSSIGFKIISSRYGIISRIDRSDWKEFMTDNEYPVDADMYRRLFSSDRYQISSQLVKKKLFKQSSDKFTADKFITDNNPDYRLFKTN